MGLLMGGSSCLLIFPTNVATRLSELIIDVEKDWGGCGIENMKGVATGLVHGDLPYRGPTGMDRLPAGTPGTFLQTSGVGRTPRWRSP